MIEQFDLFRDDTHTYKTICHGKTIAVTKDLYDNLKRPQGIRHCGLLTKRYKKQSQKSKDILSGKIVIGDF